MEYWDWERLGCQDRERRDGLENSYQNRHRHCHFHHHQLILASVVPTVVVEGSLIRSLTWRWWRWRSALVMNVWPDIEAREVVVSNVVGII